MSTVLKRFSLVGVAVALFATGCGTGPAKAGSAAIVGDTSIGLERIQSRTNTELADEKGARDMQAQGKLEDLTRFLVGDEITHELVALAAKREGITVDETKVFDALKDQGGAAQMAQGNPYSEETMAQNQRDTFLMAELGRKYLSKVEITIDFFQTRDGKEALEKAEQIAADSSKMAQFVQEAPRSTTGSQASATNAKVSVVNSPQLAGSVLWSAKPGSVVAFAPDEQKSTWMVALVKERKDDAKITGLDGDLADRVDPKVPYDFGRRLAQYLTSDVKIEVNPRYGVWDPAMITVVAKPVLGKGGYIAVAKQPKS